MTLSTKLLIAIASILTFGILGFIIYRQEQIIKQQTEIQTQVVAQKQLVDGVVRSQNQLVTKDDLNNFAKENDINIKSVQDDLNVLRAKLIAVNVIKADSDGQAQNNLPSTGTGQKNPNAPPGLTVACTNGKVTCPDQDPFKYQQTQQNFSLNEDFGTLKVPIGSVGFSAWQQNPWSLQILPREYSVDTIVGQDDNQRSYYYNKFSVSVDGKSYEIPIKTASTKEQVPTPTFSWFNPRLYFGIDGQFNMRHASADVAPSLNLGIMSYGQFKNNPDWSFVQVGVGYSAVNRTASVVITPASFNVARLFFSPLMNNTYVSPSLSINTDGSVAVGLGLRFGF